MYVIRRSDGTKWYIDERTGAGTAQSTAPGKAKRCESLWDAWRCVLSCAVPEHCPFA
jgi:hypothetical protein